MPRIIDPMKRYTLVYVPVLRTWEGSIIELAPGIDNGGFGAALHSLHGISEVINNLYCSGSPSHCKRDMSKANQPGEDHSSETRMRLLPFQIGV